MRKMFLVAVVISALISGGSAFSEELPIGAIFDLSGATGTGLSYAEGVRDYVRHLNDEGGILGGKKVVLNEFDNEWKVPVALKAYENLVRNKNIRIILGYGTAPSIAISPKTTKDKVLYMGGGCNVEPLANGTKTPYVFLVGVTYSDELMLMAQHFMNTWKKDRKPKWACFLPAKLNFVANRAKKHLADVLGMEALPFIDAAAENVDANTQMLQCKQKKPDLLMTVSGTKGIAAVLMARYKQRMTKVPSCSICYGLDLDVVRMAGKASDGAITNDYTVPWGADAPEMKTIMAVNKKYRPNVKFQPMNYKRGWVTALVLFSGIKKAGSTDPTKIKEALENMKNFSTNGLTANITYTAQNHKGLNATYIYSTDYRNKAFKKIGFEKFN